MMLRVTQRSEEGTDKNIIKGGAVDAPFVGLALYVGKYCRGGHFER